VSSAVWIPRRPLASDGYRSVAARDIVRRSKGFRMTDSLADNLENEIRELIVPTRKLRGYRAGAIDVGESLFGASLAIESIMRWRSHRAAQAHANHHDTATDEVNRTSGRKSLAKFVRWKRGRVVMPVKKRVSARLAALSTDMFELPDDKIRPDARLLR